MIVFQKKECDDSVITTNVRNLNVFQKYSFRMFLNQALRKKIHNLYIFPADLIQGTEIKR